MSSPSGLSPEVVSVLVADSNQTQSQLLCGALRRQGAFKVASCQSELSECLSILEADPADVLLLADGITENRERLYELLRGVHSGYPNLAIVLLLDNYDRELVVNSLRAGARGLFCLASMPFKSLCRCITSVHQGQYWTNTEQMRYLIDALPTSGRVVEIGCGGGVLSDQLVALFVHDEHQPRWSKRRDLLLGAGKRRGGQQEQGEGEQARPHGDSSAGAA